MITVVLVRDATVLSHPCRGRSVELYSVFLSRNMEEQTVAQTWKMKSVELGACRRIKIRDIMH